MGVVVLENVTISWKMADNNKSKLFINNSNIFLCIDTLSKTITIPALYKGSN